MLATSSAKSIEEIRSFISRQKETYRTPYEAQPKDRLRQCVFGGSSNTLDFLPLGPGRETGGVFLPIMIYPENAEVHILEDEDASRAYLLQVWAEAMIIYRSGHYSMKFSKSIQRQLVEVQKDFMPEDTEARGRYRDFWNTTPAAWSAPNRSLRRRWATPMTSRSGGSCTISTRL